MKAKKTNRPKALVVAYNYLLNDPPARQAAESLAKAGYETVVLQSPPHGVFPTPAPTGVRVVEYPSPARGGGLRSLGRWLAFRKSLRQEVQSFQPDVVVTFMFYSLSALPVRNRRFKHVACVYDIPNIVSRSSFLNRWIIKKGWKKLIQADLIWASDSLKAKWTKDIARLTEDPLVCHNCPPENYMKDPLWPRDSWLRQELIRLGAPLSSRSGGCVMVRAGAVGEDCGLEETLEAMAKLPKDYVYLMLGRPSADYLKKIKGLIQQMGLEKRAFVWDKASDETWKKALRGADLGQMIHLPPAESTANEAYRLNSGLSYNRTFLYMAAALPVLSFDDPRLESLYRETGNFRAARLAHLAGDIGKIWLELGKSKDLRRRLGALGRKSHLKKYSWEKQFGPLLNKINSWF